MPSPDALTVRMTAAVELAELPDFIRGLGQFSAGRSVRFCTDFIPLDDERPFDLAYTTELPAIPGEIPEDTPIVTYDNLREVTKRAGLHPGTPHALWSHLRAIVAGEASVDYTVASTDQLVLADSPWKDEPGVEIVGIDATVLPHIADRAVAHSVRTGGSEAEPSALLVAASRLIHAGDDYRPPFTEAQAAKGYGTSAAAIRTAHDTGIEDLDLNTATYRALTRAGTTTVFPLADLGPEGLTTIPGISESRRDEILINLGTVVANRVMHMMWDIASQYRLDNNRLPE